ncbi:MAG: hypothetical protein R6W86_17610 [Marinobacter sp.]|uniref:hypothetical protein n=1 Tax=Marinobacter sp. TaxID=50741 RepID=UPI00396D527B
MTISSRVEKLVNSLFCKDECFGNILYPESYSFFLDLNNLLYMIDLCDETRKKGGVTLPPDLKSREEKDYIAQGFDIETHKRETIEHLARLVDKPSKEQHSPSDRISNNRHSFAIEGLYRNVFYGCIVPIREYFEPAKRRGGKISKGLISKVIEEGKLNNRFSVMLGTKADCRVSAIDSTFVKSIEMTLTNWGRHLDVRVNFRNCEAVPLSEFFGVSSDIYIHDENERKEAILTVLQIVLCINELMGADG